MFSKLDTNSDLYLDQAELAAINLDKYEVCIRPFFNSCDGYKDGKVSTAEWCLCFWRENEVAGYSGDFGSGVGWEDEEEKEAEDNGEEAEEEEEEEGEADDGGYIW
ncbi:hypothetical protein F2P81_022412 [Scophthalmus maximus]|uniref:SPARC/Testican calcium-binding domain-containing protein n=1 Tax=Scophthalmus maximus TaxID=52904 RepID=A0A6A4S2X9_SCOMX|nr:hypothetical protein F2P81_022412 [Scophthalmus maximus]